LIHYFLATDRQPVQYQFSVQIFQHRFYFEVVVLYQLRLEASQFELVYRPILRAMMLFHLEACQVLLGRKHFQLEGIHSSLRRQQFLVERDLILRQVQHL
jgi:hypothetical protein